MLKRRIHRSFVSYIDKSREYYAAQGYPAPYQWPYHHEVPFQVLSKPLSACTVGVVTTAFFPQGQEPPGVPGIPSKQAYAAPADPPPNAMFTQDLAWDKDATHTDDVETYLPLRRLAELEGRIGALSKRFYGVPTDYSQRRTRDLDAPAILDWCREDGVDVALLVPL